MAKVIWVEDVVCWLHFRKPEVLQLFVYLLDKADENGNIVTTNSTICHELGMSPRTLRTCLHHLVATNKTTNKTTNKNTHLIICNFASYKVEKNTTDKQNDKQTDKQKETNKENISPTPPIKENKKENSPSLHLTVEPPPSKIYREVVELWDKICTSSPRLRAHSQARQNKVLCRVKEMGGYPKAIATITEMFTVVQSNSFYTGDNSRGWVAGFDWFFENSTNWCKVIERVHNSKSNGQKHNSTSKAEHIASERERIMREVASAAPRECDVPSWLK
jgi:hypothetical protein